MEGMKKTHQFGSTVCVMLCSLALLVVQGAYTRSLGYYSFPAQERIRCMRYALAQFRLKWKGTN